MSPPNMSYQAPPILVPTLDTCTQAAQSLRRLSLVTGAPALSPPRSFQPKETETAESNFIEGEPPQPAARDGQSFASRPYSARAVTRKLTCVEPGAVVGVYNQVPVGRNRPFLAQPFRRLCPAPAERVRL